MSRDVKTMSDHELLQELVLLQRRAAVQNRLRTIVIAALLLAVIVLAVIYVPRITAPLRQISESMQQVQGAAEEAQRVLGDISSDTVARFEDTMQSLNETSREAGEVLQTLKDSGLDKLKITLESLTESLGRLSSFLHLGG